jgi:hypothetical protein
LGSNWGQTHFASFLQNPQTIDITTKIACSSEEKQTILAGEEGFEMSKTNSIDSIEHT